MKKIIMILTLYSLSASIGLVYCLNENKCLKKEMILSPTVPVMDKEVFIHLRVMILLEALKKQQLSKEKILELFTFYDKCLLSTANSSELTWQTFDYVNPDEKYDRSFEELLYYSDVSYGFFLLFKNGYFIDYRYVEGNRETLDYVLKMGGEYTFQ